MIKYKIKFNNYYFTFGQNHTTIEGFALKDYWIRIVSGSSSSAFRCFKHKTRNILEGTETFSMMYNEEQFSKEFYPGGELFWFLDKEWYDDIKEVRKNLTK